ncbi:MAG TPA: DUF4476 domain-containing protein [Puia sp.]|nr:DUF4476 domain-containing protein [Puia sp.]
MQKPGLFGMNGFLFFLLTCLSFAAQAQQQGYLILVDAENKQPFVVRIGDQSYFSSGQGHLILPQLKDSTYKLGLRFPRKNLTERVFTVAVHRKDLGFQLKGGDSSMVLFNWQTKEIIRPVYETDSSRMLKQGIKRDDGFSRLMAAVVNDTAVMYDTYAGNGFRTDSTVANVRTTRPKIQSQATDLNISRAGQQSVTDQQTAAKNPGPGKLVPAKQSSVVASESGRQNNQPSNVNQQPPIINKDSLLAVKRLEMHTQDSLNTARKTASRDSLIFARKQQTFLRDSLNTARKAMIKDSIAVAKKRQAFLKDSLVAVKKAARDSLLLTRKNEGSNAALIAAKKMQQSKDSLLAANTQKAYRDSVVAADRANFIKDSLELASRSMAGHHSSLTHVKKLREVSLKISRKMVFLDIGKDGRADTITLFVYFESTDTASKKRPVGEPVALKKPLPPDPTGAKKIPLTNKGSDTADLSKKAGNRNTDTSLVKKNVAKSADVMACSQAATESDTEALRSAILKANSEQEKIAVAAGAFAVKCFSVSQVRFLAALLVSDKARFALMDAAHMHILDRDHFSELVDMLTDKNFQRKFLVMAEKRS